MVDLVRINWETAYASTYKVIWSDNGENWFYYNDNQYTRSSPGWAEHNVGTWAHRYVGLYMDSPAPQMSNYSFFEFELYGPAAVTNMDGMEDVPAGVIIPLQLENEIIFPPQKE